MLQKYRVRRAAVMAFVAAAAALATAIPAAAYDTASYWNKSSSPLVATGYGSAARAYGYVKIYNGSDGTRLYSYAWNKFTDGDNHQAFLEGVSQFNAGTCRSDGNTVMYKGVSTSAESTCYAQFFDYSSFRQNGLNYTSGSWVQMSTVSTGVASGADRGRAKIRLKIDIPLRPDVGVGPSYSSADSW